MPETPEAALPLTEAEELDGRALVERPGPMFSDERSGVLLAYLGGAFATIDALREIPEAALPHTDVRGHFPYHEYPHPSDHSHVAPLTSAAEKAVRAHHYDRVHASPEDGCFACVMFATIDALRAARGAGLDVERGGLPVYCTGACDACRDYARELGVPLVVSPPPARAALASHSPATEE